ncbi:MAG: hypothetical protein PHU43_02250 [Candidatus Bipolaricaulis sp.]|nr:hypothetical protein [Candidatus Bipolaricaulis sp.]
MNRRIAETQAGETIESRGKPTAAVLRACRGLGGKLVGAVK